MTNRSALTVQSPNALPQPRTLDASVMTFADMLAMGNALVTTGFLPDHIKTGAQAAAIIATGRELGMQPMRALRSLNMVKGKVTENADSQLARFKTDGGRGVFKELTHEKAVLHLVHPNGDEHTETFTMQDARAAGLVSQGGMYQKHAKAMLRSRVITAGLKSIGWEGGAGNYDPDELAPPRVQRDAANEQGIVSGEPLATGINNDTGEVEYEIVDEPRMVMGQADNMDMVEAPAQPEPPMSDAQKKFLHKLAKSHKFTERERARLMAVTSKAGASKAIEWAQAEIKARPEVDPSEPRPQAAASTRFERDADGIAQPVQEEPEQEDMPDALRDDDDDLPF